MTRSGSSSGGTGRAVTPGAGGPTVGTIKAAGAGALGFKVGDVVKVRDPDGWEWRGVIDAPSVLWADWWVVRRLPRNRNGRTGKGANHHVHAREMKRERRV